MLPVQPEPAKTRLTSSAETPKSSRTSRGSPRAIASRAAVDETVTSPRPWASASRIAPVEKVTDSGATSPRATRPAQSTS